MLFRSAVLRRETRAERFSKVEESTAEGTLDVFVLVLDRLFPGEELLKLRAKREKTVS